MKKLAMMLSLLTCATTLSGCASSRIVPPPVVAKCPAPQPVPQELMEPETKLSPDQLQRDLLDDTPITTASSTS